MTKSMHEILCTCCDVRLEAVPETEGELWCCPSCGVSDTHENIVRRAKQIPATIVPLRPAPRVDVRRPAR